MRFVSEAVASGSVWALFGICAAAAVVWWWSRRGVRRGDAPVCRRCDRDLRGLPKNARCPECGADLAKPRAVAKGERRPVGWLGVLAGAVALVAGLWAAGAMAMRVTGIRGVDMLPSSTLIAELASDDVDLRAGAWAELQRRRLTGELSKEDNAAWFAALDGMVAATGDELNLSQIEQLARRLPEAVPDGADVDPAPYWQALVGVVAAEDHPQRAAAARYLLEWYDRGATAGGALELPANLLLPIVDPLLAVQADPEAAWEPEYGDLLMVLHLHGRLPTEALERYVRNGHHVALEPRPMLRVGDDWAFGATIERRLHTPGDERPGNPEWTESLGSFALTVGGEAVLPEQLRYRRRKHSPGNWTFFLPIERDRIAAFASRKAPAELSLRVEMTNPRDEAVAAWEVAESFEMVVRAADGPAVALVDDVADRDAMERSFMLQMVQRTGRGGVLEPMSDESLERIRGNQSLQIRERDGMALTMLGASHLPHDFAFVIQVRDAETGRTWGPLSPSQGLFRANVQNNAFVTGRIFGNGGMPEPATPGVPTDLETVDIILVPDPDAAARDPNVFAVWNRPIVIRDVAVKYQ